MQISVDNNARPHNQQIINSPWLPTAHASSTCGKKFSCVRQNIRPPPCCEVSDWLQCQRAPHFWFTSATIFWETYGNMLWPSKICLVHSESWTLGNMVVKLTALAQIWHYYSSLQIRTKNRCCLSIPNNRHRYHGNADALEKCSLLQLKHIILERPHCWFNHSLYNHCQHL